MALAEAAMLPFSQSVPSNLSSLDLKPAEAANKRKRASLIPKSSRISDESDDDDSYIDMSPSSVCQMYQKTVSVPSASSPSDYSYNHLAHPLQISRKGHLTFELVGKIRELQERANLLEIIVARYHRENSVLQAQLKRYTQRASGDVLDSKNIIYEFGANEVQALLDKMGLSMYVVSFALEKINGPLFLELDEEVLEHELGVKSLIHRRRLMRIILGEDHINDVMKAKIFSRRATSTM